MAKKPLRRSNYTRQVVDTPKTTVTPKVVPVVFPTATKITPVQQSVNQGNTTQAKSVKAEKPVRKVSKIAVPQPITISRPLQGVAPSPGFNMPMQSPGYNLSQQQVVVNKDNPWIHNNLHNYDDTVKLQFPVTSKEIVSKPGTYEHQDVQDKEFYAPGYNPFRF